MLEGIKIIEMATYIAAPSAGGIMADWGADVIKIEPLGGCPMRKFYASAMTDDYPDNPVSALDNRGKRAIADHFDISYELEHQISGTSKEKYLEGIRHVIDNGVFTMVRQREMKGLGHAILTGEPLIGDQAFGVLLADDMCINQDGNGVLKQMSELYNQFRCSIVAVMEVPEDQISAYGVISGEAMGDRLYRVDKMVEKPAAEDAPSNLAVIGRYILTPDIFDIIRDTPPGANGEVQITDALQTQASKGCVLAYKFDGKRFDCGSVPGFVEATNFVYENLY